ncbi:hypothetical protein HYW20_08255 [Candidatus Woesearchaeota archaeon]|nr:hypothetical protein [Candidatus Woesearchaeota archaeon]
MKGIIYNLRSFMKNHFYVFALLLLALFFFHNIISSDKIMKNIHYINDVTFYSYNMRESLKNNQLPLWTPYFYSGRPLFSQPEYYFIDINLFLILLTGNIYLAMNFAAISHLFIAGIGMYFLINFLIENKKAAFVSALLYMFNGYVHTFVVSGNIMIIEGYSLIPFIFLFTIKALKEDKIIFNSIMAGMFTALLIFVGGVIFFPYILLIILVYCIIYVIDKNILSRVLKICLAGILVIGVAFGISAIKLLPDLEFTKLSNRGEGLPYQEYIGEPVKLANFMFLFVTNVFAGGNTISAAVGIAGFALLILGLSKFKNRIVLFSAAIILLSLLISSDSFLTKMLYHAPVFNQTRHVERAVFLFAFASSILAGFGFLKLESLIEKLKKSAKNVIFAAVVALILTELLLLQDFPQSSKVVSPNEIPILDYMGKDRQQFRTMNLALSTFIGASGYNYYSQFGISEIKGGAGIWFNDYLEYLSVAQNSPAKFWAMLNNKYVISSKNISIENLSYVGKFGGCEDCQIWESYGPYLYRNELFLPRYYIVPNRILIVGDDRQVDQLIYNFILGNFDPSNTLLIRGTTINGYETSALDTFDYIFLLKDSMDNIGKLREYSVNGGILVPDVLNGKTSVTGDEVYAILNRTGSFIELNVDEYSNNKAVINLDGKKGWLVASERFAYFPGWKASINGKNIEIFKANNAVSAVYLDGDYGKLVFEYEPNSYKYGKWISMISVLMVMGFFGYSAYNKKSKQGDKYQA